MHTLDDLWKAITKLPSKDDIADKVKEKIGSKDDIATAVASKIPMPPDPTTMLTTLANNIDAIDTTISQIKDSFQSGFPVKATIIGDENYPVTATVTANVGGTDVPIKLAPVNASLNGDIGVKAFVGGTNDPIKLDPIKIDLGHLQFTPNISIEFRLFGLLISSVRITGNANIN
jgi:hypothetical protein